MYVYQTNFLQPINSIGRYYLLREPKLEQATEQLKHEVPPILFSDMVQLFLTDKGSK